MEAETIFYISTIQTILSSIVPDFKVDAIDLFIYKEKLAGRWGFHKHIWLPVWGNSNANRVCLVNGYIIGSYPKGATHNHSYVKGNGTNQYFDSGVSASTSISSNNTHIFALALNYPASGTFYGVGQNALTLEIDENTGMMYKLSGYYGDGMDVSPIENTGMMYQLSGYYGDGGDVSPIENTGMMYQLSGYASDAIIRPYIEGAGLIWKISGTLT